MTVLEHGALFRGKQYRFLSEIARLITGSRRPGPLFFGLRTWAPGSVRRSDRGYRILRGIRIHGRLANALRTG
ncbi:MAG: DUF2924 domain-containing protein [Candidatus Binataceae bacterium]